MPEQQDGRWLTYAAAGQLLGISPEAVRQLAKRRAWPRRTPNAYGVHATVLVPEDAGVRARPASAPVQPPYERGMSGQSVSGLDRPDESSVRPFEPTELIRIFRETMESVVTPLREELERERSRVDPLPAIGMQTLSQTVEMLRQDVEHERDRADRAERQVETERQEGRKLIDELQKQIDELQASHADERRRIYTDLADARTAAMITSCEAAALRSRLDLLTERRPWWRRWLR